MEIDDERVKLASVSLRYLHAGSSYKPPLVLLHGIGVTADIWRPNISSLAEAGFSVFAIDAPGFGESDKPLGVYTLDFFSRILNEFINWLGDVPVGLLGNSMGGATALAYALRWPDRVRALILANPFGVGARIPVSVGHITQLALPATFTALFGQVNWAMQRVVGFNFCDPTAIPPELMESMLSRSVQANIVGRVGAILGLARDLGLPSQRRRFLKCLKALNSIPTLIVWGHDDRLLPASHAHELFAAMPHAQMHIFPQCGHVSPVEKAAEFNMLAETILNSY